MLQIASGQVLIDELERRFALVQIGPGHPQPNERRQAPRFELETGQVEVEVEVTAPDGSCMSGLLADFAADSARIVADYIPRVGEVVDLAFKVGEARIVLKAEVRHSGNDEEVGFFGVLFA